MAFADPQTITLGSAITLGRTQDDGGTSLYRSADLTLLETVTANLTKGGRTRSSFRLDKTVVAADPISAFNTQQGGSITFVFDFPKFGFSQADKIQMFTGMNSQLTAGSNANLIKLLSLEH